MNFRIDSLKHKNPGDTLFKILKDAPYNVLSERPYKRYQGKVIRNIIIGQVNVFNRVSDDIQQSRNSIQKLQHLLDFLHVNTQSNVIREGLFFSEKKDTVSAYLMAYNAYYLRHLPFLQTAEIYIQPLTDTKDSVDVIIITQDAFEFGASIAHSNLRLYNVNFLGGGQRIDLAVSLDKNRSPKIGTAASYVKYNIGGSFVDASIGYTTINNAAPIDTGVYETSFFVHLDRQLYKPTVRWGGGLTISYNYSMDVYSRSSGYYRNYAYRYFDVWGAWAFNVKKLLKTGFENSTRKAISLRYSILDFTRQPHQDIYRLDPNYNNRQYIIGQYNLFQQRYFKTRYVFEFGRIEDIPSGYNLALTAGVEKWINRKRIYTGAQYERSKIYTKGNFMVTGIGLGGFFKNGIEDIVFAVDNIYYSELYTLTTWRLRYQIGLNYLIGINPHFNKAINLNTERGIIGYNSELLQGYQRLTLGGEADFYAPFRFLGFRFNFFTVAQVAQLGDKGELLFGNRLYSVLGTGIRIKNESLVFRTLEIGAYFYPGAPSDMKKVGLTLKSIPNIRFRTTPIQRPEFISFE
ncbi:hypothetical protein C3K47_12965 [Solitalea longa]|uniref:Bacterial surface antigen (D15) domain-containing protein n=1 Tax=Solitalea longa TaxID=2079460 RepID=A0A2S5A1W0_9SPHI|nr:hypothetical protein [Solitalea longa]POY36103.1 hypothetical protein C3K47_12965 [Solitalea longa]